MFMPKQKLHTHEEVFKDHVSGQYDETIFRFRVPGGWIYTAMRRALHQVLSTLATSGAHRRIGVCGDCTPFGREMCGNCQAWAPQPLNACSSVFRFSQRT